MPQRIQLRRTRGWRKPAEAVVVSRPSRFGNPFAVQPASSRRDGLLDMWAVEYDGRVLTRFDDKTTARADAVDRYKRWLDEPEQADLRETARRDLAGRDLACWCPLPAAGEVDHCHAAVLLSIINEEN